MKDTPYYKQVDLLLSVLPHVAKEKCFALFGGTAINLFVRDFPRLSVDIDLTYLPFEGREESLAGINEALLRIKASIESAFPDARVNLIEDKTKLICSRQGASIKVEVTPVKRGHVWPIKALTVSSVVEEEFSKFAEIQVLSLGELYGGKICAALDRQHPRDLFDVKYLFDNGGITDEVRKGFIVSLASHPRPMNEVLVPSLKDQQSAFNTQFEGMTEEAFSYADFEATRDRLISEIQSSLQDNEREFLISLKEAKPDWGLAKIDGIERMPAVQWKLQNVQKLLDNNKEKHQEQLEALKQKLQV